MNIDLHYEFNMYDVYQLALSVALAVAGYMLFFDDTIMQMAGVPT